MAAAATIEAGGRRGRRRGTAARHHTDGTGHGCGCDPPGVVKGSSGPASAKAADDARGPEMERCHASPLRVRVDAPRLPRWTCSAE